MNSMFFFQQRGKVRAVVLSVSVRFSYLVCVIASWNVRLTKQ